MTPRIDWTAWIIRFILAAVGLMLFAHPAHSQTPLKNSLRWGLPLIAAEQFDLHTSLSWSRGPSNCTESNLSRRNEDGTLNGKKALLDDSIQMITIIGGLYAAEKIGWRPLVWFMKGFTLGRVTAYTYQGVRSLRLCN